MFRILNFLWSIFSEHIRSTETTNEKDQDDAYSKFAAREEKSLNGRITHLYEDYGLVDGYIYFDNSCLKSGSSSIKVGASVECVAVREPGNTGWRAVKVQGHSEFDDTWDSESRYQIHGTITSYTSNEEGTVDHKYPFSQKHCQDYQPWRGDKVLVSVVDRSSQVTVEVIQPFNVQSFQGRIVYVGSSLCFIDGNLAFTRQCCTGDYQPSKGDYVEGIMVECNQGQRWQHRALTVNRKLKSLPKEIDRRESNASNQSDVIVNPEFLYLNGQVDFGAVALGETKRNIFYLRNGSKSSLTLTSLSIDDSAGSQFSVSKPSLLLEGLHATKNEQTGDLLTLLPGMTLYFNVTYHGRYYGPDSKNLTLSFNGKTTLTRRIMAECIITETNDAYISVGANSSETYRNKYRQIRNDIAGASQYSRTLPGVRPTSVFRSGRLPKNLPQFDVPKSLRDCVLTCTTQLPHSYPVIEQDLTLDNYLDRFNLLLYLEEINAEIEIRQFDIAEAVFSRSRGYLALEVPGLSDGLPAVFVGDKLTITVNKHMQSVAYEGYIHDVIKDTIYTKFHASLQDSYNEESCYVTFHISRVPYRRMHHAVKLAIQMGWGGLFPDMIGIKAPLLEGVSSPSPADSTCSWLYNQQLNYEQRLAVYRILQARSRPHPYVIFGPPGTGKTVTVVESALQVFDKIRGSRILIATPSNSAADLITVALARSREWSQHDLVRLISFRRQEESLPEEIRHYCQDGTDLQMLAQYRIIISTCVSSGMMLSLGLSSRHFSHVFIDEAGQASEPECLIPITLITANPDACIVLAGDHKQLGAVVKSRIAEASGLSTSILERIMGYQPYSRQHGHFEDYANYDPNLVTKLLKNYRAHPFILELYSRLFYDSELQVCAPEAVYSLQNLEELPMRDRPIIFHGLKGEELREGDNPSWFNAAEIVQLVKYLKIALQYCKADHIGIITPYRKQVEKIRQFMSCVNIDSDVKVGSVEEFQGQERKVILISTVRSREDESNSSVYCSQALGFLRNWKRFNVSISRAQSLLIVVGNPYVLSQDDYWRALLSYCIENGCYVGDNDFQLPHTQTHSDDATESK